jgi:TonB family protein
MNRRHVPIFAIALLVSLMFHGVLWETTHELPVRPAKIALEPSANRGGPSFTFTLNPGNAAVSNDPLDVPPEATPPAPNQPAVQVSPPPPEPPKLDVQKYPDAIGRQDGKGIGTHDAEGPKPVQGRVADNDQPNLNRTPPGAVRTPQPGESRELPGQGGTGGQAGGPPAPQAVAAPPPMPPPVQPVEHAEKGELRPGPIDVKVPTHAQGVESDATKINEQVKQRGPLAPERPGAAVASALKPGQWYGPPRVDSPQLPELPQQDDGVLVAPPPPPVGSPAASPPPAPPPLRAPPPTISQDISPATPAAVVAVPPTQKPQTEQGDGGQPGTPAASADPAQQSDSESDAFSKIDGVIRQDGRLEVQFGRQVKTVRPRLPISAMIDAALGARSVTLKVSIGRDGNVTAVGVSKGSGSREVDQASLLAMYDWWFEPVKDKKGQPVPDMVYFTLNFR